MENGFRKYRKRIDAVIQRYSQKTAIKFMRNDESIEAMTFSQLGEFFRTAQRITAEKGLVKGDRAAIIAPLSPFSVFTGIALTYCNITVVPIDSTLPPEEIQKLIDFSDVKAVFTTEQLYKILELEKSSGFYCFRIENKPEFILFDENKHVDKITPDPEPDVIAIIYSSGTTGQMKGIKVPYISAVKSRIITLRLSGIRGYMSYLLMLPFNHIAGFTSVTTCFLTGCEIDFIEDADATKLQKAFLTFQPSFYIMIPKVYEVMEQKIRTAVHERGKAVEWIFNNMLKISGLSRKYLKINFGRKLFLFIRKEAIGKNVFGFATGASPCKPETAEFYMSLGIEFENFYASTETNVTLTATGVLDKWAVDSVGNVNHHPEIKVKIINEDSEGVGEIAVKTELIMKGYFREPKLTAKAFKDGWFMTGDYGYIDKNGYLYITGRIKESIILQNGKKVSPSDIDDYYTARLPECDIASRGIQAEGGSYDEIHMFVSAQKSDTENFRLLSSEILDISRNAPEMYHVSHIHYIPEIKRTSVGKVKRFVLNPDNEILIDSAETSVENHGHNSILSCISECISRLQGLDSNFTITPEMTIKQDIGMDSLNVFEMCAELDEKYSISLENCLTDNITVGDIAGIIKNGTSGNTPRNITDGFPLEKTDTDIKLFRLFTKISRYVYDFHVYGLKNIDSGENYIFCPNHECHFDGMWVTGCLADDIQRNICSIAADYLFSDKIYSFGVRAMGGIPTDRTGNPAPAMKKALECLKDGRSLIIHPEGTRTGDGRLGTFRNGAAKLSINSGVKIIPVCINGAFEIFPRTHELPALFDFRNMRRYPVQIRFGRAINPENKSQEQITAEISRQIRIMKKSFREH